MPACPPPAPSSASPPPPRSARWGSSASSPTTRVRPSARCSSVRFVLAAALFWVLVAATGGSRAQLRALSRRDIGIGARAWCASATAPRPARYFAALERLDASLLSLLLYTFPAIVTVAAIALGRERANRRTAVALVPRLGGPGARPGRGRAPGRWIRSVRRWGSRPRWSTAPTSSPRRASPARVSPLVLSALVCTGAATTLTLGRRRRRRHATWAA